MNDGEKIAVLLFGSDINSAGYTCLSYTGAEKYREALKSCMKDPRLQNVPDKPVFFLRIEDIG